MLRLLHIKTPTPPLSTTTSINLSHYFTTTPIQVIDPSSSLTLYFLKNSCGLPHATALLASQNIHIKTTKRPHSVLTLLKSYNFTQPHIANLIARRPKLLLADPIKTLKPKFDFLHSIGLTGPDLIAVITSVPRLLQYSLHNKLIHNYNLLKTLVHTDANLVSAIKSLPSILVSDLDNVLLPEIKNLKEYGVPVDVVLKLLTMHVKSMLAEPNRFQEIFEIVKKVGINPKKPIFAHAFGVLGKLPEQQWAKRVENFKMLGWTEEQVLVAFGKHPYCMVVSTDKVAKNMQEFREKLGWDPEYISANPVVLSLSYEKRIVPRSRILCILKSKGLLQGRVVAVHLMIREKEFLKKFVLKYYEQVPELIDEDIKGKMEELGLLMGGKQQEFGI